MTKIMKDDCKDEEVKETPALRKKANATAKQKTKAEASAMTATYEDEEPMHQWILEPRHRNEDWIPHDNDSSVTYKWWEDYIGEDYCVTDDESDK